MAAGSQPQKNPVFSRLIGEAPQFLKAIGQIPAIASSGATVLISGETGTGKELVAHAIHYLSARAHYPFVAVNCGSLPDTLLEDELFGHERGAFTHAEARRQGLIAQAEQGTLFLDEIDTMARKAQVDLLRVLQNGTYRVIGSSHEREADLRVVAATNLSPDQLLSSDNFRADLFYRLSVFLITLPPLRQRKEDIPALAAHFLEKHSRGHASSLRFAPAAIAALFSWDWPGNVRELENAIIRGIHLSRDHVIQEPDLGLACPCPEPPDPFEPPPAPATYQAMKNAAIAAFERKYLAQLMTEHRGNVSSAARAAGKERRGLGKLLKKYRVDPKSFQQLTLGSTHPHQSGKSGAASTRQAGSFSPSFPANSTPEAM